MPVLFSQNTGRVNAIPDAVAAGSLSLGNVEGAGGRINYSQHKTIITRIGLSAAGNYQFLHTIGNDVYVYVFGDRMGQVVLHGLSFAQSCNAGEKIGVEGNGTFVGPIRPQLHGFELLYKWYKENRIATRKSPVTATIGINTSFEGFITALSGDVQDSLHRTIQFQLTLATLPTI